MFSKLITHYQPKAQKRGKAVKMNLASFVPPCITAPGSGNSDGKEPNRIPHPTLDLGNIWCN